MSDRWRQGVAPAGPSGAGKFAQPPEPPSAAPQNDDEGPDDGAEYRAFGPMTAPARPPLHVEFIKGDGWRSFTWSDVRGTSGTRDPSGEVKTLAVHFFSFALMLTGRHLGELKRRLARHGVAWVQVYDAKRFPMPRPGEPVVLSLELVALDDVAPTALSATAARSEPGGRSASL